MPVSSCQSILIFVGGDVLKAVDEKTYTADLGSNALYYLLLGDPKGGPQNGRNEHKSRTQTMNTASFNQTHFRYVNVPH